MFRKKIHSSKLFKDDVWIVNLALDQALTDPEIANSNKVIFTEKETKLLKEIPDEVKGIIFAVKKNLSRTCEVIYHGPERYRGEPFEREENPPDRSEPQAGKTQSTRRKRNLSLEEGDRIGQSRLFTPSVVRVRDGK